MRNSINVSTGFPGRRIVDATATGERILMYRRRFHLTQQRLADALGVSVQSVSNWEQGKSVPSINAFGGLMVVFNVTLDDLIVFKQSHGGDGDDDGQAVSFYTLYRWIVLERMVIMTKDTVINTIRDILNKAGMEDIVSVSENMNEIADIMIYQKADEPVKTEYFAVHEVPLFPIDKMQNILYQYGSEKPYIYVGTELQILIELGNNARYVLEFGDDGISELMFFEGKWVDNREARLARYNHNTSKKRFIMELIYSVVEITEAGDSVEDTEIKEIKKTIDQYIKPAFSD